MSVNGREALLEGREALRDVWDWLGGPSGCPGVVRRPSRMVGRLSQMVAMPFLMSGGGREALRNVPEWSGGPT